MTVKTLTDCAAKLRKPSLIDAELENKALDLRRQAEAIEPGFDAEEWLRERGL